MRRNQGIAHLALLIIVFVAGIIGFGFLIIGKGNLPVLQKISLPTKTSSDKCGNEIGNGAEIISGPLTPSLPHNIDNPFRSLTVHPTNSKILYVGTEENGILKSKDGGVSWERLRYGIRHGSLGIYPEIYDISISASNPNVLYAATTGGPGPLTSDYPTSSAGVYKSTDAGMTWQRKNCGLTNAAIMSIFVSPDDENKVFAGLENAHATWSVGGKKGGYYEGGLFESVNGGDEWQRIDKPVKTADNTFLQIKSASGLLYTFGRNGRYGDNPGKNIGFLKSTDEGKNWSKFSEDIRKMEISYFDVSADGKTIYIASSSDGSIMISNDGGDSWDGKNMRTGALYAVTVSPGNSKKVIYGKGSDLFLSTDGLKTEKKVISGVGGEKHFADVVFAPSDSNIVYAIAVGYDLYKSTDGGENFTKVINLREDVLSKIP